MKTPESTLIEIARLYRDGWGQRNIARMLELPEQYVYDILRGRSKRANAIFGGRLANGQRPKKDLRCYQ